MLGKSLVTGTILTLLAGGVVYYGTDVGENISLKSDANAAETSGAESSSKDTGSYIVKTAKNSKNTADSPSLKTDEGTLINPKVEKSIKASDTKVTVSNEANESKETPTRKWIDQYLKTKPKTGIEAEVDSQRKKSQLQARDIAAVNELEKDIQSELANMDEPNMSKPLEAETDDVKVEIIEGIEIELFSEEEILEAEAEKFNEQAKNIDNIWASKNEAGEDEADVDSKTLREILKKHHAHDGKSSENEIISLGDSKMVILEAENVEGFPDASETEKPKMTTKVAKDGETIYCVENHLKENVYKFPEMENHHDHAAHNHADRDKTVKIIMEQAEKIAMPELRDRAYLDLVSYALDNHDAESANIALSKIEQVELRDTARNRIAVDYAENGNAEKAFAILGDIEVDALRDVMRLQVIEALIATEAPR